METDLYTVGPGADPVQAAIRAARRPIIIADAETVAVSVIVPAHNEALNLPELCDALRRQLQVHGPYEILIVDDGSTDATLSVVKALAAFDPSVKYLALTRNFGHQSALRAGLDHVRGDCVITMDADHQHPPDLIPELVEKWRAGFKVVTTIRNDGKETSPFKRATAALFYRLAGLISEAPIKPGTADFRLLDRTVVDAIRQLGETDIFLRGIIPWLGFRTVEIHYTPHPRRHGESSYDLRRMLSLALTGITATSIQPLRAAIVFAAFVASLTVIYGLYAIGVFFLTDAAVPGWTSVIIVVSALGSLQLLILGIIGEYLGRVLRETRRRPSYIVRETNLGANVWPCRSSGHERMSVR